MKFSVSVIAERPMPPYGNSLDLDVYHVGFMVEAVSLEEAVGKGLLAGYRILPTSDGWKTHHVSCGDLCVSNPFDFEVDRHFPSVPKRKD